MCLAIVRSKVVVLLVFIHCSLLLRLFVGLLCLAIVRSKVMVLLLFIHCSLSPPLFVGLLCKVIVLVNIQYFVSFLVLQLSRWGRESGLLLTYFYSLLMYSGCQCYVTLPHGAACRPAVCDCAGFQVILTYF